MQVRRLGRNGPAVSAVGLGCMGIGFLAGRVIRPHELPAGDMRRELPRFQGENFEKNMRLVAHVEEAAARVGCTPAQLALAWVLAQGEDVVPIPGTKQRKYLEENVAALGVTLSADELRKIGEHVSPDAAAGARYAEAMMRMVNR